MIPIYDIDNKHYALINPAHIVSICPYEDSKHFRLLLGNIATGRSFRLDEGSVRRILNHPLRPTTRDEACDQIERQFAALVNQVDPDQSLGGLGL